MISSALSSSIPMTILSGFIKSSTAAPSFKNSGLEATANGKSEPLSSNADWIAAFTFSPVVTGTVLLVATTI